MYAPGFVTKQIVRSIRQARVVVADVTGGNPNVYYEVGIADSFRKAVILLVDNTTDLPFDTAHMRHISLGDDGKIRAAEANEARSRIKAAFEAVLAPGYEPESVVASADLTAQIAESDDPYGAAIAEISRSIDDMRVELGRGTRQARRDMRDHRVGGSGTYEVPMPFDSGPEARLHVRTDGSASVTTPSGNIFYATIDSEGNLSVSCVLGPFGAFLIEGARRVTSVEDLAEELWSHYTTEFSETITRDDCTAIAMAATTAQRNSTVT